MSVCKRRPVEVLFLATLLVIVSACKPTEVPVSPRLPVSLQVVELRPVPQEVDLTAQVEGTREVEVRARVTGILLTQSYQEGAEVKAGDLLFKIDPAPYQIALALAQALWAQESARCEQVEADAVRQAALWAQQATSAKEAADAKAVAAAAQAARAVAAAKVKSAELDLSYCEVRAPIAGFTGRLQHSEGSLVGPGADGLLTTVVQRTQVWARFGVSEEDFSRLFKGDAAIAARARVAVVNAAGQVLPLAGKVNFVAAQVESRLGTIQMRAEFTNVQNAMMPGQFVRIRLTGQPLEGAVTMPASCLLQSAKGRFVYVVGADNLATMRPVQLLAVNGAVAILTGGLQPGDRVILDNLVKMRPGAPVVPRVLVPATK